MRDEYEKVRDEVYKEALSDVSSQLVSVFLFELNKTYGFGEKRLRDVMDGITSWFSLICDKSHWRGKFEAEDCIKYLKDKYNIDVDKEMEIK